MTTTASTGQPNPQRSEAVADVLRAVAHPLRLRILDTLSKEEWMSVTDLCKSLSAEQSLLSHHLAKMRRVGMVQARRQGQHILYSLNNRPFYEVLERLAMCKHP